MEFQVLLFVSALMLSLLANSFCSPIEVNRKPITSMKNGAAKDLSFNLPMVYKSVLLQPSMNDKRDARQATPDPFEDIFGSDESSTATTTSLAVTPKSEVSKNNADDDDFDTPLPLSTSQAGQGSNLLSLVNMVTTLFKGSSGGSSILRKLIKELQIREKTSNFMRRRDVLIKDNEIDIDNTIGSKSPPRPSQRQDDGDTSDSESSENSNESNDAEESVEDDNKNQSKESSDGNASVESAGDGDNAESDFDSDEPPEGDGQGGGILGLLAGLSGGEDGQSDLGSLLATVSGIVANLSGDGFDLNALIASGLGLFVGLLSGEEENPGAVLASYLLTSLDTLTGGGAQNNGEFFGKLISKLIKGTSAGGDPDASSEENGDPPMADSAGFFLSFIMGLLGDMSKGSSGSSSH